MIKASLTGFFSALTLILAIGAQNSFVLRQSLTRSHILTVCLICAISDALLVVAGVLGFGQFVEMLPDLPWILAIAGAGFLFCYAMVRMREVWRGSYHMELTGRGHSLRGVVLTVLALTWLNPHVYLDTMGLLGAISTQFIPAGERIAFVVAASLASFMFFFSLGYGGRYLAPVMQSVRAWRILDSAIAAIMLAIAASLLRTAVA